MAMAMSTRCACPTLNLRRIAAQELLILGQTHIFQRTLDRLLALLFAAASMQFPRFRKLRAQTQRWIQR